MTEEQMNKILELQYLIDKGSIDYEEAVRGLPSDLDIERVVKDQVIEEYTVSVKNHSIKALISFLKSIKTFKDCYLSIDVWGIGYDEEEIDFHKVLRSLETNEEYFNRLVRLVTIARTKLSIDKRKEQEEYELYLRLKEKFQ